MDPGYVILCFSSFIQPSSDLTRLQNEWKVDATLFNKFPKEKSKNTDNVFTLMYKHKMYVNKENHVSHINNNLARKNFFLIAISPASICCLNDSGQEPLTLLQQILKQSIGLIP